MSTPQGPQWRPERAGRDGVERAAQFTELGQLTDVSRTHDDPIAELHPRAGPPEQIHPPLAAVDKGHVDVGESGRDHEAGQTTTRPEIEEMEAISWDCGHKRLCVRNRANERGLTERAPLTQ